MKLSLKYGLYSIWEPLCELWTDGNLQMEDDTLADIFQLETLMLILKNV